MIDETDKKILNEIQSHFPLASRPFLAIGNRIDLSEDEVIERIKRLKSSGIIRRIGGNFNSNSLGFRSTLCAAKVPEKKIDFFVETVNRYPGVTHNYLRSHPYNVWFTFIARDMVIIENALNKIKMETGVTEILNLPAIRTFKIKVEFDV